MSVPTARRALVTGDSRGIGAAIARRLAADGAMLGLTRGVARELGPRGITVKVIQPGTTATDANPDSGEFADAMRQLTAVGHYGRPEDIASAVAYLATPEAGFITGMTWNVDGGFGA